MHTEEHALKRGYSKLYRPLRMVAAAACLWPALAIAGPPNPTGSDANRNTAAGKNALFNVTTGGYNTAIGAFALEDTTTGSDNTACGYATLANTTSGSSNTGCGYAALYRNTSGSYNTATGSSALISNTSGTRNTASGVNALYRNASGNYNTATGGAALYSNTSGGANVADGAEALYANTAGIRNTATGYQALRTVTTGAHNVAIGYRALFALTGAGGNNIALGAAAGYLTTGGSNNIYIGAYGVSGNESNVTRIGRTQTKTFITGIAGVPLSGASVVVTSSGQLGVVASSARYKQDIRPLADVSERLDRLRPVSFGYRTEPGATHYGLIAEEVEQVMPELVVRDEENRPESVQYLELIPLLLQERTELNATLELQKSELERQRALIEQQAEALAELRRTLDTRLAVLERNSGESVASLK